MALALCKTMHSAKAEQIYYSPTVIVIEACLCACVCERSWKGMRGTKYTQKDKQGDTKEVLVGLANDQVWGA